MCLFMTFLSCIVGEIDGGTTLGIAKGSTKQSLFGVFGVWLGVVVRQLRECAQSLDNTRD